MKIRSGFVSNSSSSSFVIVMSKEHYDATMKKLGENAPYIEAVLHSMDLNKSKFMDRDIVSVGEYSDAGFGGGMFENLSQFIEFPIKDIPFKYIDDDEDYVNAANAAWNDFYMLATKDNPKEVFTHSQDW